MHKLYQTNMGPAGLLFRIRVAMARVPSSGRP